jgi:hypothetical protein
MGIVFCNLEAKEREFKFFIWHRLVSVCDGFRISGEHGIFLCLSEWHFTINTPYNTIYDFLHLQKKRYFNFSLFAFGSTRGFCDIFICTSCHGRPGLIAGNCCAFAPIRNCQHHKFSKYCVVIERWCLTVQHVPEV